MAMFNKKDIDKTRQHLEAPNTPISLVRGIGMSIACFIPIFLVAFAFFIKFIASYPVPHAMETLLNAVLLLVTRPLDWFVGTNFAVENRIFSLPLAAMGYLGGAVFFSAAVGFWLVKALFATFVIKRDSDIISGREITTDARKFNKQEQKEGLGVLTGYELSPGVPMWSERANKSFCLNGAIGSGKTQILRNIIHQIMVGDIPPDIIREKILMYDYKGTLTGEFPEFALAFAPHDKRGYVPWISKEITNEAESLKFWSDQFPVTGGENDFFNQSAASLGAAITNKLNADKAAGKIQDWGFADIVKERRRGAQYLCSLCERFGYDDFLLTIDPATGTFERTSGNVIKTFGQAFNAISMLAKAELSGMPKFDLRAWIADTNPEKKYLIVQGSEDFKPLRTYVTRMLMTRLVASTSDPTVKRANCWLFFDEVVQAKKDVIDSLKVMVQTGREKSFKVFLAYQSFNDLQDEIGAEAAKGLISTVGCLLINKCDGDDATYLSESVIGKVTASTTQTSASGTTLLRTSSNESVTQQTQSMEVIPASELGRLGKQVVGKKVYFEALIYTKGPVLLRAKWPPIAATSQRENVIIAEWVTSPMVDWRSLAEQDAKDNANEIAAMICRKIKPDSKLVKKLNAPPVAAVSCDDEGGQSMEDEFCDIDFETGEVLSRRDGIER